MTPEQLLTLKAYINSVPEWAALPQNSDTAYFIAAELNKTAVPAYVIWDSRVDPQAIVQNGMVWADFKNLSAGQIAIWTIMTSKGYINAAKLNERDGLEQAFGGKNAASNIAAQPHLKRSATVLEKLFSTGTGTDALPATTTITNPVSYQAVEAARAS